MVEVRGPLARPQGLGRLQGASLANLAVGTQDRRQELAKPNTRVSLLRMFQIFKIP
ncbi:MAG: hypothetical protein ACFFAS_09590 [Promethearchaeota archaeon]